ncbi:MAG TPA: hypothetical protein VNU46_00980 [Gemmatimonadaceae bacterium]|jgi:hypothetical protein|nr:hypothetical protein [Gemmatimonadaceae bacterium]
MSDVFNDLPDATLDALIARARARVGPPLTEWQALSARLREDGLIRQTGEFAVASVAGPVVSTPRRGVAGVWHWGVRAAIGAALVAAGVVAGLGWSARTQVPSAREPVGATARMADNGAVRGDSTGRLVSETSELEPFASPEAAKQVLVRAQSDYQRAAAYLAASDTGAQIVGVKRNPAVVYQERLAALDAMMSATQRALKDAPHDPLLHQYYQSTVGAREATEQRLAQAVPVGMRVSQF